MLYLSNENNRLVILIEGYAYPYSREYWDNNWLSVEAKIVDYRKGEKYETNDVCLQTTELVLLKKWFQEIGQNINNVAPDISFIEPCLAFKYLGNRLEVLLKYGLNPLEDENEEYIMNFEIDSHKINTIIKNIDKAIEEFPEKIKYPK